MENVVETYSFESEVRVGRWLFLNTILANILCFALDYQPSIQGIYSSWSVGALFLLFSVLLRDLKCKGRKRPAFKVGLFVKWIAPLGALLTTWFLLEQGDNISDVSHLLLGYAFGVIMALFVMWAIAFCYDEYRYFIK